MESENGGNGRDDLQLVNRLNESRSPYVSPDGAASRPTIKNLQAERLLA